MKSNTLGILGLLLACLLMGCESMDNLFSPSPSQPPGASDVPPDSSPIVSADPKSAQSDAVDIPADLNHVRAAAQYTALQPSLSDAGMLKEIALHELLYRAAHETNVGDITRHFLLEPIPAEALPSLKTSLRDFRLRVLGRLVDLDVPIVWGPSMASNPAEKEYFPGSAFLATRLKVSITERESEGMIVRGEIGDWTVDVGSSRQGFTATWDGQAWALQRDRVRLVR